MRVAIIGTRIAGNAAAWALSKGGGRNWRETTQGLFAQPRNLLSPS